VLEVFPVVLPLSAPAVLPEPAGQSISIHLIAPVGLFSNPVVISVISALRSARLLHEAGRQSPVLMVKYVLVVDLAVHMFAEADLHAEA